jgi:hypothetical protein
MRQDFGDRMTAKVNVNEEYRSKSLKYLPLREVQLLIHPYGVIAWTMHFSLGGMEVALVCNPFLGGLGHNHLRKPV